MKEITKNNTNSSNAKITNKINTNYNVLLHNNRNLEINNEIMKDNKILTIL